MKKDTMINTQIRNAAAYWILGATNNFSFFTVISAAHDILAEKDDPNLLKSYSKTMNLTERTMVIPAIRNGTGMLVEDCNPIGTGAILLAQILPFLFIQTTGVFFLHSISYSLRAAMCVTFSIGGLLIVCLSSVLWLRFLGVVLASLSTGAGELTFISLSSYFEKSMISTWSSGHGAGGLLSVLLYAVITAAGVSPNNTLLIMTIAPFIMGLTYFLLLDRPKDLPTASEMNIKDDIDEESKRLLQDKKPTPKKINIKQDLHSIIPLLKYVIPLTSAYTAQYFMAQALFELINFKDTWVPVTQQYRWYMVFFAIGVFISKSSVKVFQVKQIWLLAVIKFVNVALLLCQIFFRVIPYIGMFFIIPLFDGLLGGLAYVNTFNRISQEIPSENLEYSLGVATVARPLGITIAGLLAVPAHNMICSIPAN